MNNSTQLLLGMGMACIGVWLDVIFPQLNISIAVAIAAMLGYFGGMIAFGFKDE